ncbi:MAG: T9SS type A sorting domain-containing protein [Polaribacter sp.]
MKKITLLFLSFLTAIGGFAQTELTTNGNFETGDGTGWTGNALQVRTEGGNSYNFANVTSAGAAYLVNLSNAVVLKPNTWYELSYTASTSTATENRTMISGIGQSGAPYESETKTVTLTSTNQTFTHKFNSKAWGGGDVAQRVLFDMGAAVGVVVIDNVSLQETTAPPVPAPTDAPPTPLTRDAGDVISLYGDAYNTTINFTDADFDFDSKTAVETHAGNEVLRINNGSDSFIGLGFDTSSNRVDASTMTKFHIDFWIAGDYVAGQVFNSKLSNQPADEETAFIEINKATALTDAQTWVSVEGDLGSTTRDQLRYLILTYANSKGKGGAPSTVYVDNIYLFREAGSVGSSELATAAPNPPTFDNSDDFISLFSNADNDITTSTNAFAGASVEDIQISGNATKKVTIPTAGGGFQFVTAPQDLTSYTHMYFNYYVSGSVDTGEILQVFLQGGGSNIIGTFNPGDGNTDKWVTVDLPISDFASGDSAKNAITNIQFTAAGGDGFGPVYLDNILFYKEGTASVNEELLASVKLFPNPASNLLKITAQDDIQSATIYNVIGKKVKTISNNFDNIDVSDLNSGVYLIKYTINNAVGTSKFIKQ